MQNLNAFSRIAERENVGEELGDLLQAKPLAFQFAQLFDGVVNELDFIPRCFADDTVLREVEDFLEGQNGVFRILSEKAVDGKDQRWYNGKNPIICGGNYERTAEKN